MTGDLLQAGIQGFLATTYAMDKIAAQAADIVYLRRPSYGTFSTQMNIAYLFGIPQSVQFSGLVMDADRVAHNAEHKDNCYDDWIAFNRSSGMRGSALEHQIPEQLFSTEESPAEGISTAKAFALATAEGQKIYTLTEDNADQLANITIDEGARNQIQNALNAGLEVTVHESPITLNGWTGSGYTLIDPDYGVGGYLISGGGSGGVILTIMAAIMGALEGLIQVGHSGGAQTLGARLKNMARYARYAKLVGALALVVEVAFVLPDSNLSWSSKAGRLSGALFAYASTSIVVVAAFAFAGIYFAALAGLLFAVFISVLLNLFYDRYFVAFNWYQLKKVRAYS